MRRLFSTRALFFLTVLALTLARGRLNPPFPTLAIWVLVTWYATAGTFFLLWPPGGVSASVRLALRFAYFAFEVAASLLVLHLLGGSGWLALLLLVFPVLELHLTYPGVVGFWGSLLALAGTMWWTAAEALGVVPHDPFYSVAAPLHGEPWYVSLVLLLAALFLVALPARVGRRLEAAQREGAEKAKAGEGRRARTTL